MANRFPLTVNPATQAIEELAGGDGLDLSQSNIVNVGNVTVSGSIYSDRYFYANGTPYANTGPVGSTGYTGSASTAAGYAGSIGFTGSVGPAALLPTYTAIAGNITLVADSKYFVDTSLPRTLTLPASPILGQEISIIDGTGNAATNNITVARNGNKIQGLAEDMTVGTNRAAFVLAYYNATHGWLLTRV